MTKWAVRPGSSFEASFNAFATCLFFAVSHARTHTHRDTQLHTRHTHTIYSFTHTCIFRDTQNEILRYIWTSYHFSCLAWWAAHTTQQDGQPFTLRTFSYYTELETQSWTHSFLGWAQRRRRRRRLCWNVCHQAGRDFFQLSASFLFIFCFFFLSLCSLRLFHLRKMCIEIWDICLGYYYKRPGLRSGINRPNHHLTVKRIFFPTSSSSAVCRLSLGCCLCRVGVS